VDPRPSRRIATLGYSVAPLARGEGIATDAVVAATAFAWTITQVQRIDALVEPWNLASCARYNVGLRLRGETLPAHRVIDGRPRDMLRFTRWRPTQEGASRQDG